MPISVACACGKRYNVAEGAAGKKIRCKECGEPIAVPRAGGSGNATPQRKRASGGPAAAAAVTAKRPVKKKRRPADELDDFTSTDEDVGGEEEFSQNFNDDFGDVASPPVRRRKPAGSDSARGKKGSKGKAKQRQRDDDDDEGNGPWWFLGVGACLLFAGIASFFEFKNIEEGGEGPERINAIIYAIYEISGKFGVLIAGCVVGLGMMGYGVYLFKQRD